MGQNAEELRRDIAQTRSELSGTLDAIGDRVSPGRILERKRNKLSEGVRAVKDRVMGSAADTGHTVTNTAHGLTNAASDKVHGLADAATSMPGTVKQQAQGAPMAAGAIAFGIGFLFAAAIPASRTEKDLSGQLLEKAEPLKELASEVGHDMVDTLKEPAAEAVAEVKAAATDAAKQVSHSAADAAHDTAEQAKTAAQNVKAPSSDT
jgi:hypothetical protein